MDFMAILVEWAKNRYPASYKGNSVKPLQGTSFVAALVRKNAAGHETLFNEHFGAKYVRQDEWKLVSHRNESWHLYKINDDETELNDLSKQHPDIVQKMDKLWQEWARENQVLPKPGPQGTGNGQ